MIDTFNDPRSAARARDNALALHPRATVIQHSNDRWTVSSSPLGWDRIQFWPASLIPA